MIKEEKVIVDINTRNVRYYQELEYEIKLVSFSEKKKLEVPVEQVSKHSRVRITAICEICNSEKSISINKYYQNHARGGFYSCFKCKNKKKEMTNLKIYGVKSYSETEDFKNKFKKTCLEKYGVENPNMLKDFREKTKKTCLKKYGFTNPLLRPEIVESNRQWMSSDEFKEKSKASLIKNWGVDSFSKTAEFKMIIESNKSIIIDKIKKTFLEKYGVDSFSKTDDWKSKYLSKINEIELKKKETCLKKYGVENVTHVKEVYDKIIKTKIQNNQIIPYDKLTDWEVYKRKVRRITNSNKKNLMESWNGLDYYDNEEIKSNFFLSHTHRFYPTIDHKISVFYGFNNNIEPEIIGNIENLCITKRYLNCIKNKLIESEFNHPH
jgi:hypothetical protein